MKKLFNSKYAWILAYVLFMSVNLTIIISTYPNTREYDFFVRYTDSEGYYEYLPSFFINNDVEHMTLAIVLDDGRHFDKYSCGIAYLQMPLFFVSH
ncbi:MAG: hypothetical protein ABIJ97_05220, partial [Bacteroidota bacterium]